MVERNDALGAGRLLDDALAFAIINGRDFVFVVESLYCRLVVQQYETLFIQ